MVPEIGHFLLIVAMLTATIVPAAVLWGAGKQSAYFTRWWRPTSWGVFTCLLLSALCLVYAFWTDDFSVAYVANHSNTNLAPVYKVAALWGSHEGSMLLWILMMSAWALVVGCGRHDDPVFMARLQAVMLWIIGGFCLFLVFTSNPFARLLPMVPVQGRDLNPVLQDVGMIVHPPLLFMGYSGLCLGFAGSVAALLCGRWKACYLRSLIGYTALTWIFLTAGNALGSWWAYTELGWGGWWFWDPVENASFIPWLLTTALLHSLIQTARTGQLRRLSILLGLVGFALCLLGSFIVRSGIVQSVHAFASDPNRGLALLLLSVVILLPAFMLYAAKANMLCKTTEGEPSGHDFLMIAGVTLLVVAGACVLIGTLYPLAYDMLGLGTLTVGAPYFNSFFAPMTIFAAALMGAVHLGFKHALDWVVSSVLSVGLTILVVATTSPRDIFMATAGVWGAAWLFVTTLCLIVRRFSAVNWGLVTAHAGLIVSMVGVTGVSQYESEALLRMGPGLGKPLEDVIFVYTETRDVATHSYRAKEAQIEVLDGQTEALLTTLRPQRQTFTANGMQMSAAGIEHGILRDLYASMGNPLSETEYLVRISIKPLASWIWGGAVLMIIGGAIAFVRRRNDGGKTC